MDKFEQAMQKMKGMKKEEIKKMIEKNKQLCICGGCPSYNDCAKGKKELLYCATGKSPSCIKEEKGCLCPTCPITPMIGLKNAYYCLKGTEREQRGM